MKKSTSTATAINLSVMLILLLAISYSGYAAWSALAYPEHTAVESLTGKATATPTPVPELKLNAIHQRQGEAIEVDAGNLGRPNPFLKPSKP